MRTKQDKQLQRINELFHRMDEPARDFFAAFVVALFDSQQRRLTPKFRAELARASRADRKITKGNAIWKFLVKHRYLIGAGELGQRTLKALNLSDAADGVMTKGH